MFAVLSQILKSNENVTSKNANPPSSAILVVYLDKAEALPVSPSWVSDSTLPPSVPTFRA